MMLSRPSPSSMICKGGRAINECQRLVLSVSRDELRDSRFKNDLGVRRKRASIVRISASVKRRDVVGAEGQRLAIESAADARTGKQSNRCCNLNPFNANIPCSMSVCLT